jgi:hypothetical protein
MTAFANCECTRYTCVERRDHLSLQLTGHHEKCPNRPDILEAALKLIADLARGIERWAADEENQVHQDAWDAYRRAKALQGKFLPKDQDELND